MWQKHSSNWIHWREVLIFQDISNIQSVESLKTTVENSIRSQRPTIQFWTKGTKDYKQSKRKTESNITLNSQRSIVLKVFTSCSLIKFICCSIRWMVDSLKSLFRNKTVLFLLQFISFISAWCNWYKCVFYCKPPRFIG